MDNLQKELDKELREEWEKLFKSMGVESMDELIQKADKPTTKPTGKSGKGKKDYSKLVPVKKQITRGGRTVETTVYVSPKEAEEMKQGKGEKNPEKDKRKKSTGRAKVGIIAPHDKEKLSKLHSQLDKWKDKEIAQTLKEASKDQYLISANFKGKAVGVASFRLEKDTLHMENFGSTKELLGVGKPVINKLLDEASSRNLGVSIKPPSGSTKYLERLGFKDNLSGAYSLGAEDVKKVVEGNSKESEEKPSESPKKAPEKAPEKATKKTDEKKEKPEKSKDEVALDKKRAEHKVITKKLRTIRKKLGSDEYRAMLEYHGISWEKNDHQGVNTMRATMAAAEFVKAGGKLDVNKYLKHLETQEEPKKEEPSNHRLDKDYFDLEWDGEDLKLDGGSISTYEMVDSDKEVIDELMKVRSEKEFNDLYAKVEDEGKLTSLTSILFTRTKLLYDTKRPLYKVDGYDVALSQADADTLGKTLNSDTDQLSSEEDEAIKNYTGSMFGDINDYFRRGIKTNKKVAEYAKHLDNVLNRNTLTKDTMIYRGARFEALGAEVVRDIRAGDFQKYIGAEITDNGYMSTSLSAMTRFSGEISFQIKAPKGTKGKYIDEYSSTVGEKEVLLPRDTTMRIEKIRLNGSKIEILTEIINQK